MPLFQKQKKVTLRVDGMSCAHCEMRVSKALLEVPGVKDATASHERGEAIVTLGSGLKGPTEEWMAQLVQAVDKAGYKAVA